MSIKAFIIYISGVYYYNGNKYIYIIVNPTYAYYAIPSINIQFVSTRTVESLILPIYLG